MTPHDVFLHRANSPRGANTPLDQIQQYADEGFHRFEIDIFAPTMATYKFCHALDDDKVSDVHEIDDGYLESIIQRFPDAQWLVDLKCIHLTDTPKELMNYIVDAFGDTAIYLGVRQNVLEYYHELGVKTGQYFYDDEKPMLDFEPDFYCQSVGRGLAFPVAKTIYSCKTFERAAEFFDGEFPYLIVESSEVDLG